MPRIMTEQQRTYCIELIPKMMSGELSKSSVRELTQLTDGAINVFRDIAKFHSYEVLVETRGKYKEELYDLTQTCNLVELSYATGLCDANIFSLARKVIVGFRTLVGYRQKLGYPLIKGVSVEAFIPNENNKIEDSMWSTWNVEAIDCQVLKSKGDSLRNVLLAHESNLRSCKKEHVYPEIKSVQDLKKYADFIPQEEVKYNFDMHSTYAEQLVEIVRTSKKLNAVEIAKVVDSDPSSVRCDLRFIKLHGPEEFLKYGRRQAPKRYEPDVIKSLICLKDTFGLSQEFVAFVYKCDRGELRRYTINKEAKKEDFVPIFPNIPATTNLEVFVAELQKATGLSDAYQILELFYNHNGLTVPDYHKPGYEEYLKAGGEECIFCPQTAKDSPFYIGKIDHETRESFSSSDLITSISSDSFNQEVNATLPERKCGRALRGNAMKKSVRSSTRRNAEVSNYISEQKRLLEKCGSLPDEFNYKASSQTPNTSFKPLTTVVYPLAFAMFDKTANKPQATASYHSISVVQPTVNMNAYQVVYNNSVAIDCDMGGYLSCVKCALNNISGLADELLESNAISGFDFIKQMPVIQEEPLEPITEDDAGTSSLVEESPVELSNTGVSDNSGISDFVSETDDSQYMLRFSMLEDKLNLGVVSFNDLKSIEDISEDPEWLKDAFKKLMGYDLGITAEEFKAKYQGKKGRPPIVNPFSQGFSTLPIATQEYNQNHFMVAVTTYVLAKEAVLRIPAAQKYEYVGDYSALKVKHFNDFISKMDGKVNQFVARHVFDVSPGRQFYMEKTRKRNELPTYQAANILREAVVSLNIENNLNWGANRAAAYLDSKYGLVFGVNTVRKAMKATGATFQRKNLVQGKYNSFHGVNENLVPNYVERDFNPTDEWQLICTDITEVNCVEGKCYVAFWQDAFSAKIYNATLSELETVEMVKRGQLEVIRMAPDGVNCIVHTDRGHQYMHLDYCKDFDNSGKFLRSSSGLGRCLDNAMVESLNGSFKEEVIARIPAKELTRERVIMETKKWVEHYNYVRPHSRCGGISPECFLKLHREQKAKQANVSQSLS